MSAPAPAPSMASKTYGAKGAPGPQGAAARHADKLRAKANRKAKTPGPGAYSPSDMGGAFARKSDKNPGSSFLSKSKRLVPALGAVDAGDPGAYDPHTLKELASTSKKSFAKSMRSGAGDFGGKEKREMNLELMGEGTPGPGAYNGGDRMRNGKVAALAAMDSGEKMPSSSFHSKTAQREKQQNLHVPGAGAYTPHWTAIEAAPSNPANSLNAKGARFEKTTQVTDPMVGPGSYESHLEGSLQVSVSKAVSKASRANPGFGTLTLAHDLPFVDAVQDAMDDPGPGAYEAPKSTLNSGGGSVAAFKSGSQRGLKELGAMDMGDPGAYDPYTHKELATTSKKSFGRSNRAGMGDFGGTEKREMNLELMGENTPGPGAYNGGDRMRNGKVAALAAMDSGEKMPSSSFHSKTAQREKALNLHVPGAGAYTPNLALTQDSRMSCNSGAGMRGKGSRFVGADKLARDQNAEPGPGAYETEILRTGGRSNLSAYDTGELMPSAAFASDALRELPWTDPAAGKGGKA
jgi:hypothetical protein